MNNLILALQVDLELTLANREVLPASTGPTRRAVAGPLRLDDLLDLEETIIR